MEYQINDDKKIMPFLRMGGGWYAWGMTPRNCWMFCWRWDDDLRKDSFGINVGCGVRIKGLERMPSSELLLQLHPYTTYENSWGFVNIVVAIGK